MMIGWNEIETIEPQNLQNLPNMFSMWFGLWMQTIYANSN